MRLAEREVSTACLPSGGSKLAEDAGNHFLAWARLHLHPICAATSPAKEQGCDSPWACLVEGRAPYGS